MEINRDELSKPAFSQESTSAPCLWNPDAAGLWSLLLTPVFGSALLLLNWKTLRKEDRVTIAKLWLVLSVIAVVAATFSFQLIGLIFIIIWYFAWQRQQTKYIKEKWGSEYPRRGWLIPLLIGILANIAWWGTLFVLVYMSI